MTAIRYLGCMIALVLFAGCGLPPNYEPKEGERFQTLVDIEHWSRDKSAGWSPFRDVKPMSQAAILTMHLGKDAPLPHAWWIGDNCLVTEGVWRNTDFTPPSHGTITLEGAASGKQELTPDRNGFGYGVEDDDWNDGSTLSIKATGDTLPAFDFSATVAPLVKLTTWDLEAVKSDEIKVARSKALELAWTAGSGRVLALFIQFSGLPDMDVIHSVWCTFPADTGTGTVPLEVIQTIHDQSKVYMSHLYFGSVVQQRVTTESTDIDLIMWNSKAAAIQWEK